MVSPSEVARRRAFGATINYSHPLMRDCIIATLNNEGSGGIRNHMNLRNLSGSGLFAPSGILAANWKGSIVGVAPRFSTNESLHFDAASNTLANFSTTSNFSLFCYASRVINNGANVRGNFIAHRINSGGFTTSYSLRTNGNVGDTIKWLEFVNTGSTLTGTTDVSLLDPNIFHSFGAVNHPSASLRYIYLNGRLEVSGASTTITDNNTGLKLGGSTDTNFPGNAVHACYLVWSRALSAYEMEWLAVEPFDWTLQPVYRKYFLGTLGLTPLTLQVDDNLNVMSDAVSLLNGAAANYGVILSDSMGTLADSVSLLGGDPDYQLTFGDSINALNDSQRIVLTYCKLLSDSINNWADAFAKTIGYPVSVFDSNQFNWADAIAISQLGPLTVVTADSMNNLADAATVSALNVLINIVKSDSMNFMADAVRIYHVMRLQFGDNFVLSDSLQMRFNHLLRIADTINALADALNIKVNSRPAFADDMNNLADAVSIQLNVHLTRTAADQMVMSDAVSVQLGTPYDPADISRIRRYLNDTES